MGESRFEDWASSTGRDTQGTYFETLSTGPFPGNHLLECVQNLGKLQAESLVLHLRFVVIASVLADF